MNLKPQTRKAKLENLIENVKVQFEVARKIADKHEEKTGNLCVVRRVIDYVDQFNGRDREHYSFDVVEIIKEN